MLEKYYKILELNTSASKDDIKRAYRRGICKYKQGPILFLLYIIIFICFGDIHLFLGTHFISACQVHLLVFDTL